VFEFEKIERGSSEIELDERAILFESGFSMLVKLRRTNEGYPP